MKSRFVKAANPNKRWLLIDAKGKKIGRLAVEIAKILRGKNKEEFTPHLDMGDNVIVINASLIDISDEKKESQFHYHHSFYPGGLRARSWGEMMENKSDFLLKRIVRGMLPKNTLGKYLLKNLKVYKNNDHPHKAQKPVLYEIN